MHKYADLKKSRPITSLQGNLVVSKRRKSAPRQIITSQFPIKTWLFILFMFVVSGLYIRYQALYVDDSVFRDAYILINDHFISKPILPPPNETDIAEVSTSIETTVPVNNAVTTAPVSGTTVANSPVTAPVASTATTGIPSQATVSPNIGVGVGIGVPGAAGVNGTVGTGNVAVANGIVPATQTTTVSSVSTHGSTIVNGNANPAPVRYPDQPAQNIQSLQGVSPNQVVQVVDGNPNQVLAVQSSAPVQLLSKPQEKVFSYYQPVLNSTSTKVGFFVVNKKTAFRKETFYQDLLANLVKFESSNPKVRNFFDPRTQLNNAWVENDTLILDFNSFFENSKYGYMGVEVKLQQVLWTFFNYDQDQINQVSYISFMIDGKRRDTIGGDGKILKPFYSRKNLSSVVQL